MRYRCLDLRDLVKELNDLRGRNDDEGDKLDVDEKERLAILEKLAKDLSNDIENAAENEPTLIAKNGWVDYCRELADDVGYLADLKDNPLANYVDWDGWAEAVAQDYYEVEFDGETWLHRSY